jgi:hypothetical protein
MCPIEPVATLILGPAAFDYSGLAAVVFLYALAVARNSLGRKPVPLLQEASA